MAILRERQVWKRAPRVPRDQRVTGRLNEDQRRCVLAALRAVRGRYGSWRLAAEALGMKHKVLQGIACKARAAQAGHALRVAQLVGVTVDDVLCGRFPRPGACPTCGRA